MSEQYLCTISKYVCMYPQNTLVFRLTLAVLGGIEGVVPVLGHGHQVLDPGDVGACSQQ